MKRLHQIILVGSFIGFSWLAMQVVHEFGHILGAWLTGGTVSKVVLYPLTISRTDLASNPHPLSVVWAGPIVGSFFPFLVFLFARICRAPGIYLFRFFAGFCLTANGVYIGVGSFPGVADAGDMLRHGCPQWFLVVFGLVTVPLGLYLFHGIGPKFGVGEAGGKVSRSAAIVSLCLFLGIAAVEVIINSR